jgi:hypothetical protein
MDSQHSELFAIVGSLQECARRGDWKSAFEAARALRDSTPPASAAETGQYLDRLRDALVVAKASRTHLAATLVRLNAAARFSRTRASVHPLPSRQKFGESPEN